MPKSSFGALGIANETIFTESTCADYVVPKQDDCLGKAEPVLLMFQSRLRINIL